MKALSYVLLRPAWMLAPAPAVRAPPQRPPNASSGMARVLAHTGAGLINVPSLDRHADHKIHVAGERPASERTKAKKDLVQAASLASYFLEAGDARVFNAMWRDTLRRGPGWRARLMRGKSALLKIAPDIDAVDHWKA